MKTRGNYTIEEDNYDLNISYEYYWDDGDHENAPEKIKKTFFIEWRSRYNRLFLGLGKR